MQDVAFASIHLRTTRKQHVLTSDITVTAHPKAARSDAESCYRNTSECCGRLLILWPRDWRASRGVWELSRPRGNFCMDRKSFSGAQPRNGSRRLSDARRRPLDSDSRASSIMPAEGPEAADWAQKQNGGFLFGPFSEDLCASCGAAMYLCGSGNTS